MASLNIVHLIGYLGKDPELRYSQNNNAIANLSLATDESYIGKDGYKVDRTEWHRIVAYGKTAELCERYLAKGSLVYIEGSLQTRKWQDQNGQDRYTTEIKAQRVQFLDRKGEAQDGDNGGQRSTASQQRPPAQERGDYGSEQGRLVPERSPAYDETPF